MGKIRDFFSRFLPFPQQSGNSIVASRAYANDPKYELLWAYQLAFNVIAERIAALMSKCEIKTYINGEERHGDNYYLFNVSPNCNQSAAEFKRQLVKQLILSSNHEALIVAIDGAGDRKGTSLYVATAFDRHTDTQLYGPLYDNVHLDVFDTGGGITFSNRQFTSSDTIYIKYTNEQISSIFDHMRVLYSSLAENAGMAGTYRQKYTLEIDQTAEANPDFNENMQALLNEDFDRFIQGKNAVLPLYSGMKINQVSAGADLGQNASIANKSINAQVDEIIAKVGMAFNLPRSLLLGDFEKDDLDNALTYCIDPLAELITQALNRCYYGKDAVLGNTYCKVDTEKARHIDYYTIGNISNSLISSGVYSINEVRRKMGERDIDPVIGDVHMVTRNYGVLNKDYLQDTQNVVGGTSGRQKKLGNKGSEGD